MAKGKAQTEELFLSTTLREGRHSVCRDSL